MKKSLFFLIVFVFYFDLILAKQNKSINNFKGCAYQASETHIKDTDNLPIKLIEVDIHDFRKWTVNGVRILTSRYRYVQDKYKKRFNATITVTYGDTSKCIFDGRVRHSGDEKDHISQLDNSITQSLDIHLKNGNIRGITRFKLLRPKARGNLEDEIFLTEILRNLNYLAPRTTKVASRVNNVTTNMIFQEKAAKEMLEFNGRREGPILEGDERFFFKSVEKIEDNNLSGWDSGVVPLMNKSSKYMLSKQVNSNIVQKSNGHKEMSLEAATNLNLIYLYFSNRFQDELNNFNYFDYDLDNTLLGAFSKNKIRKLDEYNLLIQATNSHHGLAVNNRKFYWNSIEKYFEPINYDSNPNINKKIESGAFRLPISEDFFTAFSGIKNKLNTLDLEKINRNLSLSGLEITKKEVEAKKNKILKNLDIIKNNYLYVSADLIEHNKYKKIENILKNFNTNLKKSHPNTYLVKQNVNKKFQRCEIFLENCYSVNFSEQKLSNLLEGELEGNKMLFQYIGKNLNLDNLYRNDYFKKLNLNNIEVYYEDGVKVTIDESKKIIEIKQVKSGAKIYLINGELDDFKINYNGFSLKDENNSDIVPKDYPTSPTGLTGCLSFINMKLKNIEINANNSTCEDTVNLIQTSGFINKIHIQNSYSDALDVDFSDLQINNINVKSAGNDCVDFSSGKYIIDELVLSNCGDKALSVGEKSKLSLKKITANKSKFGIASKDGSIVELKYANFKNLDTCLAAYKKKQEFEGGKIQIENMQCDYLNQKIFLDKHSMINQINKT